MKRRRDIQTIPISQSLDPKAQELVRIGLAKFSKPEVKGVNGCDVAFPAGHVVTWVPRKARQRCYGLPLAYEPLPVEIVSGPRVTGDYRVRILAKHAARVLTRPTYDVDGKSLIQRTED